MMERKQSLPRAEEDVLNRKVAEAIALGIQPYSVVDDCGFRALEGGGSRLEVAVNNHIFTRHHASSLPRHMTAG